MCSVLLHIANDKLKHPHGICDVDTSFVLGESGYIRGPDDAEAAAAHNSISIGSYGETKFTALYMYLKR